MLSRNFVRSICNIPTRTFVPIASEHYHFKGFVQKDPRTILFVHGLLGLKKNYKSIGRHLARNGYKVIGVDMRNHGESENALPLTTEVMTDDLAKFINDQKLENLVLVGHSMGAKIVMRYALQNPQKLSSLVVVDNTPEFTPLDESFYENIRILANLESSQFPSDLNRHKLFELIRSKMTQLEPHVQTFLLTNVDGFKNGKIHFKNPNQCFLEHNVIDQVSIWPDPEINENEMFTKPVLVVKSKTSGFIRSPEPFKKYFSDFQIKEFDTGHYIITEKSQEFLKDLETHLEVTRT